MPYQTFCSAPQFSCDSNPRRVRNVSAWADVTTPPCWSSSRQSSVCMPPIVWATEIAHNSSRRACVECRFARRVVVQTRTLAHEGVLENGSLLDDVDHHAQSDR